MTDQVTTPTESAINPKHLSPEGRELLIGIMRQRVEKIGAEIARLGNERRDIVEWLAVNDPDAPGRDGMSHLYDCCDAAPTEPHRDDCSAAGGAA